MFFLPNLKTRAELIVERIIQLERQLKLETKQSDSEQGRTRNTKREGDRQEKVIESKNEKNIDNEGNKNRERQKNRRRKGGKVRESKEKSYRKNKVRK